MRKAKPIHSELTIARESATITCRVTGLKGEDSEEWRSFLVEKREGCWCVLTGCCWHEEAVGKLTRGRHPMSLIRGTYLAFSGGS